MEATGEPGFFLGINGFADDTVANFLNHFHTVLRTAGAKRVYTSHWMHWDPLNTTVLPNARLQTIYSGADNVDYHAYPDVPLYSATEADQITAADTIVSQHAAYVARVRTVLNRPGMAGTMTEIGATPDAWTQRLISENLKRNWKSLAWAYNAWDPGNPPYDDWNFSAAHKPQVMDYMRMVNTGAAALGLAGFNWPNAGRTWLLGWDQGNPPTQTTYANRTVPFQVAAAHGVRVVRVFTWDAATIGAYNSGTVNQFSGSAAMLTNLSAMCTAAAAQGVKLILSPRLDKEDIEALAGTTYGSLALAQQAMVTSGSAPWNALENLLEASVAALAGNQGVYSWEVTNEPPYMLGSDAGNITIAQLAAFLGHFNGVLKDAGAVRVNLGSWPMWDQTLVSDAHVITMHTDCDIIDAHFYPPHPTDPAQSTAAQADTLIASNVTFVNRVRTLLGRPSMPAMIGEVGDTPDVWFQRMMSEATDRDWLTLAWGYDAYDVHAFNDTTLPQVLDFIATTNGGPTYADVYSGTY